MAIRIDGEKDNRGGTKPGAGRPKGTVSLETKRKQAFERLFIQEVNKNKKEIVEALIKKSKEGDVKALVDILNRIIGKPIDRIDHTTKGEQMDFVVISYGNEDSINKINKENGTTDPVSISSKETSGGIPEQSVKVQDSSVSQTGGEVLNGAE